MIECQNAVARDSNPPENVFGFCYENCSIQTLNYGCSVIGYKFIVWIYDRKGNYGEFEKFSKAKYSEVPLILYLNILDKVF